MVVSDVTAAWSFLQVGYWEVYDGSQIRELEGSKSDSINGMDICERHFVTGGGDKLIKVLSLPAMYYLNEGACMYSLIKPATPSQVWRYDEGEVTHVGVGHSGDITRVKVAPNGQHIVSVSEDGAILRWRYPFSQGDEGAGQQTEQ